MSRNESAESLQNSKFNSLTNSMEEISVNRLGDVSTQFFKGLE